MKIYSTTNKYQTYSISDIKKELLDRIGSKVGAEPAVLINLGTGEQGIIFETDYGDIVLDNLTTNKCTWDAQNIIEEVLSSWNKSMD
mgnify:CR=1 FL=1|nr:MAG TPA: hypothetical protein [Caudoviricetes sp.]